jgi:sodium ion-translocating decarboxylase beta subunit
MKQLLLSLLTLLSVNFVLNAQTAVASEQPVSTTTVAPATPQAVPLVSAASQEQAEPLWKQTLRKVKGLPYETGIAGFFRKDAPDYMAKGYIDENGKKIEGHDVKVVGNLPYGVGQLLMVIICLGLIYLAVVKDFEPLLLLPIGFGGLLANLPMAGVTMPAIMDPISRVVEPGGFLYYFFNFGVSTGLFPIMIFFGVGAMTDFGPLIANPRTAMLGAAAQLGIFIALIGALVLTKVTGGVIDFDIKDAASIGIIGGADGPTAIWLTTKLSPQLLGAIAVAAYSYMALVPIIQPPIMRLLVPEAERKIVMKQLRHVSKMEKVCFPLIVLLLCALLLPSAVPLIGALMLGNLAREVGPAVSRIADTMANPLINIVTIMLGLSVGSKLACEKFLNAETLGILVLGLIAFGFGTAGGCIMGRIMNKFSKDPINPLIGSAGVSAVPMAARVSNKVGLESDPTNYLLMHAMGPNVSGVIGSAVVAGVLYKLCT